MDIKMSNKLDHLVIAADSLEQGREWVGDQLGIDMPYGGTHPKMGTHNHLVQLDDESFLEIIAINKEIAAPNRPRWFNLDDPLIQKSLKKMPRLLTWVINTTDIDQSMQNAICSFGSKETITRNNLSWDISLPADGRLLAGGMLPYLIQWHDKNHPASNMKNLGISLIAINIYHPYPEWLRGILDSIGATNLVNIHPLEEGQQTSISAIFNSPKGIRKI